VPTEHDHEHPKLEDLDHIPDVITSFGATSLPSVATYRDRSYTSSVDKKLDDSIENLDRRQEAGHAVCDQHRVAGLLTEQPKTGAVG
jgi:hypothetical protein